MTNSLMSTRRLAAVLATVALAVLAAWAPSSRADSPVQNVGTALTGPDGTFSRQAGAHADLRTLLQFNTEIPPGELFPQPVQALRDVRVDLPAGFYGNPTAAQTCTSAQLVGTANGTRPLCPVGSQVGIARIVSFTLASPIPIAVYNMERPDDLPALFEMNFNGEIIRVEANVRPTDYGISALSPRIAQAIPIASVDLTLWGVPSDPSHDADRFDPANPFATSTASSAPRLPFLTNPTSCPGTPARVTISTDFWENPGDFSIFPLDNDLDGTPLQVQGCDRVPFRPSIDVSSMSRTADAPTGLNVDLAVPQEQTPDGLASATVRRVAVRLPSGFSVSPSSAAGLGACAPDQIRLGTNDDPTCPDSAKIGSVEIDTPLLETPLEGDVILAKQGDNPFGSLIALYIVAKGPGFYLKLPGRVDLDRDTGQVTTVFDNNPQLPFSHLRLQFRGGSQAAIATPTTCGRSSASAEVTSWASDVPVHLDAPMTIDQGCEPRTFAPSLAAGTTNPAAGAAAPFTFTLTRADRTQYLSRITATLPPGLLAQIASAPQCPEPQANAGTCALGTEIGSVAVQSGPGAQPLALKGRVYLTGPHGYAPFGLSIVVPTAGQAGPFDLGNVVVRAGINVDRTDAHATVVSDPVPSIKEGIPLRVRQIALTIDRPGFMINPTSCAPSRIRGDFTSLEGSSQSATTAFQPIGCGDLSVKQQLAIRFTGRDTTDGTHPGIAATVSAPRGTTNLKRVVVKLPLSVALDPDNAEALCTTQQRAALNCPKNTIVGSATVRSILPDPLKGPVYFVKGERKSPSGRIIPTLPKLWIPLTADGVTIDVNASSDVDDLNRLVTTFDALPDAPFSRFDLNINGGKHGIIVVSGKPGTCDRDKTVDAQMTGQNGKVVTTPVKARIEGCRPKVSRSKATSKAVTLHISGLGAGRLSISGRGVVGAHRTIVGATEASIVGRLTTASRRSLQRHGRLKMTLRVQFKPKSGRTTSLRKTITVRR